MNAISIIQLASPPDDKHVLLATDIPRVWWRIETPQGWSVFVATNQDGVAPVVRDSGAGVLFVGAEQAVFALRKEDGALLNAITDTSDVRALQPVVGGMVLALAADQILAFSLEGALRWRQVLPDLVDDVAEEDGHLVVTDVAGESYLLDAAHGQPLRA